MKAAFKICTEGLFGYVNEYIANSVVLIFFSAIWANVPLNK